MASPSTNDRRLTEDDVRAAAQQYDVTLIFHASLPRRGFSQIDGNALLRCHALQLLDLSGNKLTTLAGVEPVAAQLTFLNVAENKLCDISVLAACSALQSCHLEGNELSSVAALKPLLALPQLSELVLQRSIALVDTNPAEVLLLDNPVCRSVEAYQTGFVSQAGHIRWVDNVPSFKRKSGGRDDGLTEKDTSNQALLFLAAASHEAAARQLAQDNTEEGRLRKLLADAAKRCEKACHA